MQPTAMFRTLVQYAGIDEYHARVWWKALVRAQWSTPRSWQQALLLFDQAGLPGAIGGKCTVRESGVT
jgi:hypothetical protein